MWWSSTLFHDQSLEPTGRTWFFPFPFRGNHIRTNSPVVRQRPTSRFFLVLLHVSFSLWRKSYTIHSHSTVTEPETIDYLVSSPLESQERSFFKCGSFQIWHDYEYNTISPVHRLPHWSWLSPPFWPGRVGPFSRRRGFRPLGCLKWGSVSKGAYRLEIKASGSTILRDS